MLQIPAMAHLIHPKELILFLLFVVQPIQCGPQISGLPPTVSATIKDVDQQHQRHAFTALEPELAENIFNREGVAKNPLRRTTTIPITDRIDIGHNAGPNTGQQPQRNFNGEKLSGIVRQQQFPPRMPRSIPRRSEYDAINEDFVSEYDALNLDFNLDDDGFVKEAKKLEVVAREFSWQDGEGGQKTDAEFPPKEWWDGEEVEEAKEKPKKEEWPTLKASKLVEVANKEEKQKDVPRKRGSPIQQPNLIVDLPQRNIIYGKRRSNRVCRRVRMDGVARLDGWPTESRPFGSIDREKLRIVPKLVPSYPPPIVTTPITTTKATKLTIKEDSLTTKKPLNIGQKKEGGGHEFVQSPRLPAKKKQFLSTQQEFFHDLPSGRDEASAAFAKKQTILLPPIQQQPQLNPPIQQQIVPSHQIESNQFRPFPAGQPQPFQPVLNLGASTPPLDALQQQTQFQDRPLQNHGQSSPSGRLLPTGFMHIATLESLPQQDGNKQILIDGKRFWVERTVPLSQFFPPPNNIQTLAPTQAKEPAEELPTLLEMPHLQEQPNEQKNRQLSAQNAKNENPTTARVVEGTDQRERNERREQFSSNKSPTLIPPNVRGSRIANSARVFSLAGNEPPLWTGQQPQNHQFNQQFGGNNGEFGGGNAPNGGGKRRGGIGKSGNNLLALNLGTALSQIFGNFSIEHDAKLVERKAEPMEMSFSGTQPTPTIEGDGRGNEANSEPHRLTRFFERPQRHLHGN